ncbi:hypothetical protein OUZ56_010064 [Daphnia magna]|uniref:Uncharacterized protein n=1 Tax=Daphnia magna TaxID=35525 RepID=A0ABR0AHP9_9CRUS|nr:hypothetical protein OUZ56_010064 [Daphnia magna]
MSLLSCDVWRIHDTVHHPSWSPGAEKQSPYFTNTLRIFSLFAGPSSFPIRLSNSWSRSAYFSVPVATAATGVSPSLISATGSIAPNTVPSSIHCLCSDKLVTVSCLIISSLLIRVFPVYTLFFVGNAREGSTSAHPKNPFKSSGLVLTSFIDRGGTQHLFWFTSFGASSVLSSARAPMVMSLMTIWVAPQSSSVFLVFPKSPFQGVSYVSV